MKRILASLLLLLSGVLALALLSGCRNQNGEDVPSVGEEEFPYVGRSFYCYDEDRDLDWTLFFEDVFHCRIYCLQKEVYKSLSYSAVDSEEMVFNGTAVVIPRALSPSGEQLTVIFLEGFFKYGTLKVDYQISVEDGPLSEWQEYTFTALP